MTSVNGSLPRTYELDESTTPLEAGLGFFVAMEKGEFAGRSVLAEQKAKGPARKCVAFRMTGRSAPPRQGYSIWRENAVIGRVTSGTQSPSLGIGIGMGYVPAAIARPGTVIDIEARGKRSSATIVPKPFYRANR